MAKNTDWDRLSKEPYELDYVFQLALKHKQQLNKAIKTGTAVIDLNNLKQLRRICHAFIKLYSQKNRKKIYTSSKEPCKYCGQVNCWYHI